MRHLFQGRKFFVLSWTCCKPIFVRDKLYLLFSVKDLGPLGDRILLGEAIMPVNQIKRLIQENIQGYPQRMRLQKLDYLFAKSSNTPLKTRFNT